jgi:hypothetical protein
MRFLEIPEADVRRLPSLYSKKPASSRQKGRRLAAPPFHSAVAEICKV